MFHNRKKTCSCMKEVAPLDFKIMLPPGLKVYAENNQRALSRMFYSYLLVVRYVSVDGFPNVAYCTWLMWNLARMV